jgi:hypothetical protein
MKLVAIALLAFFLGGCTQSLAKFTMASSRPLPATTGWIGMQKGKELVKGESTAYYVFLFFLGVPTIDHAMQDAMSHCQCDLLLDVNIESTAFVIPFFYGESTFTVTGRPVRFVHPPSSATRAAEPSDVRLPAHLRQGALPAALAGAPAPPGAR